MIPQRRTVALLLVAACSAATLALPARTTSAQGTAGAPGDPASVLRRARAEYATVRTARAEFEQEIKNPLLGRTLTSRGTLVQRKPGRLAVTFTDPAGDRIVSDGQWLWVYIPSSAPGQVLRLPAGDEGTGGVDLAATVLDAPREGYNLTAAGARVVSGRPAHGVQMVARPGAEVPFPRATLWVDDVDASVREVAITDGSGVSRTIRLLTWEKNANVDATSFAFKLPKGVKVVQQP